MTIFTIGHSNKSLEAFISLLVMRGIETIVDVRSAPVSSYSPHFNYDVLENTLRIAGIDYEFMGGKLGGRPRNPAYNGPDGKPDYAKMAQDEEFIEGLGTLERMAEVSTLCLMCSEENPANCHRAKLISAELTARGIVSVTHILGNGELETEESNAKSRKKAAEKQLGFEFLSN